MPDARAIIPFEAFMAEALYHPARGYYSRRIPAIGFRGDFTTAPHLSELPALAISSWAAEALRTHKTFHLIEIGPGEGRLASSVLKHLPWMLRRRVKLHLVETSPPLRELQKKRLGRNAIWHDHPSDALKAAGGKAVIYSNELVDAFPVRRFKKTFSSWREIAVQFKPLEEVLLPEAALPPSSSFSQNHSPGQEIEIHDSYRDWLSQWMPAWEAGTMLTIDYGAPVEALYHRRPRGTIRAYLLQQRLEGLSIYQNTGRQDLTADVNFTDLIDWTELWCETRALFSFSEFLTRFCRAIPEQEKTLLDPHGPGSAFQVLEQIRRD